MPRSKRKTCLGYEDPFAVRLRILMDEAGIPQSALAEHIGVTRQAISAYSLGASLPDIEKFEGIADFFEVSTEYLLGRTDVKKADASKQATAEYLGLSEGAIDAIQGLQQGLIQQSPLHDYKPELLEYPLVNTFSAWLEAVDLPKLAGNLHKLLAATDEYNASGAQSKKHRMSDDQRQAILLLQQNEYIVLSLREQLDYFEQTVQETFRKSIDDFSTKTEHVDMNASDRSKE